MIVLGVNFSERANPEAIDKVLKTQNNINLKKHKKDERVHSCGIEAEF